MTAWPQHIRDPVPHVVDADGDIVDLAVMKPPPRAGTPSRSFAWSRPPRSISPQRERNLLVAGAVQERKRHVILCTMPSRRKPSSFFERRLLARTQHPLQMLRRHRQRQHLAGASRPAASPRWRGNPTAPPRRRSRRSAAQARPRAAHSSRRAKAPSRRCAWDRIRGAPRDSRRRRGIALGLGDQRRLRKRTLSPLPGPSTIRQPMPRAARSGCRSRIAIPW